MKFANYLINGLYLTGAAAVCAGVFLQFGAAWALIAGGALAIRLSTKSAEVINAADSGS